MSLASHLFSSLALARRRWYASHPAVRRRLARCVVSVGNLSVGGTGKTPVVMSLARLLIEMGERPSILSRGYKRPQPSDGVVVVSDGVSLRGEVVAAGDEPLMMARSVPQAVVLVSSERYLAGRLAETRFGCTVHLLDDGFQHLGLIRDLDLLIVTDEDVASPHTLPLGRLREPLSAAAAADAVLVSSDAAQVSEQLAATLGVSQLFRFERMIEAPRLLRRSDARNGFETSCHQDDEDEPLVRPGPVFAVAGIARPHRFFDDLQQAGWNLAGTRTFADHHQFSAREIADVARAAQASGAHAVVMTEKDMVRLMGPEVQSLKPEAGGLMWAWVPLRVSLEPAFAPWLRDGLARARRPSTRSTGSGSTLSPVEPSTGSGRPAASAEGFGEPGRSGTRSPEPVEERTSLRTRPVEGRGGGRGSTIQ